MEINELIRRLGADGWRITDTQVNRSRRLVHRLENGGFSVVMFAEDAADMVTGRATLEEIIERNRAQDLADPWPLPPLAS